MSTTPFKYLECTCAKRYKKIDRTGKGQGTCPHCGADLAPSANWYIRYKTDGKLKTVAISPRKRDAETRLAAIHLARRSGGALPGEETIYTWEDGKKRMEQEYTLGHIRQNTWWMYRDRLKLLDELFSHKPLQQFEQKWLTVWKERRQKHGAAAATINREITTVKRMFSLICSEIPAAKAPQLHLAWQDIQKTSLLTEDNYKVRALQKEQIHALIDHATPELALAIQIAAATGLRATNVFGLQYDWINPADRTITIPAANIKNKKHFLTTIPETILAQIAAIRKNNRKQRYLFPSPTGTGHVRNMDTAWRTACKKAGITGFSFHDLRHFFVSNLIMQGVDIGTVSKLANHSSVAITLKRYGHLSQKYTSEIIEQQWNMVTLR